MASEFEKFLFGDTERKQQLQSQIDELQRTIATLGPGSPQYQNLLNRLQNLRAELEQEMYKQGATDQYGRLLEAKDVQNKYIDKDYLRLMQQQLQDEALQAQTQGLRMARQAQLQGQNPNIGEIMGKYEAIQRQGGQTLTSAIKGEKELAYQKAGTELGRKQQYATQLTEMDRASILDSLNQRIAATGLSMQQQQYLSQQLAQMPDGFLQQALGLVAKGGTEYLLSLL